MATSDTTDEHGDSVFSEVPLMTVWAALMPLEDVQLRAAIQATQMQQETTHIVTIRHLDGLSTNNRLRFGDRTLEILGVANVDERNHKMQLFCKELS